MDTAYYISEIERQLADEDVYQLLSGDPLLGIIRKIRTLLDDMVDSGVITDKLRKFLVVSRFLQHGKCVKFLLLLLTKLMIQSATFCALFMEMQKVKIPSLSPISGCKCVVFVLGQTIQIQHPQTNQHLSFQYDCCFWSVQPDDSSYSSQEAVYNHLAQPLLQGVFQGMMGFNEAAGIISRFCEELFKNVNSTSQEEVCDCLLRRCAELNAEIDKLTAAQQCVQEVDQEMSWEEKLELAKQQKIEDAKELQYNHKKSDKQLVISGSELLVKEEDFPGLILQLLIHLHEVWASSNDVLMAYEQQAYLGDLVVQPHLIKVSTAFSHMTTSATFLDVCPEHLVPCPRSHLLNELKKLGNRVALLLHGCECDIMSMIKSSKMQINQSVTAIAARLGQLSVSRQPLPTGQAEVNVSHLCFYPDIERLGYRLS
ncbi:uncharacterized protein LOC108700522 [Xenopus laevis]|uniref:Uncharacterized protein LOC108700522 n=1 Tax=Xenopus laevis TaxID=8355 RepID=A0A8J1LM59_XENLA|nr:uncharacterized protein LOC108700522 [Xenopus laevis]